jgi:hypothetical protein
MPRFAFYNIIFIVEDNIDMTIKFLYQIAGGSSPVENNASDTFTQLEEDETNQLYLADNPLCHGSYSNIVIFI